MKGLTLAEARILKRGLQALTLLHVKVQVPGEPSEEELDLIRSLDQELGEFLNAVQPWSILEMWTDGAARPTNPGPAGIGVVGKVGERTIIEVAEYIGRTTNNVAEYQAVVAALHRAIDVGARHVRVSSDSKLVVEQYWGRWKCNEPSLIPLLGRVKGLAQRFETFDIKWIPREQNREADGLSVAGAYTARRCGLCWHEWHVGFCLEPGETTGTACGCPTSSKGGLEA